MHPTQFGLRPRYPCEHLRVQTQSDHSQCCRGLQGLAWDAVGQHLCAITVSVRHSWTWSCSWRPTLYTEQALDPAQMELFTWLVMLCCCITWMCTDTQRKFRAQTLLAQMLLWLQSRYFNIQMELQLKSTFSQRQDSEIDLDGSFYC